MEGESRRDFLRKLTYVAPVIITFQLGEEDAEASGPAGKGKAKGKSKHKRKKFKRKRAPRRPPRLNGLNANGGTETATTVIGTTAAIGMTVATATATDGLSQGEHRGQRSGPDFLILSAEQKKA